MLKKICFICFSLISGFALEWDLDSFSSEFTPAPTIETIANGFSSQQAVVVWADTEGTEIDPRRLYVITRDLTEDSVWTSPEELRFPGGLTAVEELHLNITDDGFIVISFFGIISSAPSVCVAVYNPSATSPEWETSVLTSGGSYSSLDVNLNDNKVLLSFITDQDGSLTFNTVFYNRTTGGGAWDSIDELITVTGGIEYGSTLINNLNDNNIGVVTATYQDASYEYHLRALAYNGTQWSSGSDIFTVDSGTDSIETASQDLNAAGKGVLSYAITDTPFGVLFDATETSPGWSSNSFGAFSNIGVTNAYYLSDTPIILWRDSNSLSVYSSNYSSSWSSPITVADITDSDIATDYAGNYLITGWNATPSPEDDINTYIRVFNTDSGWSNTLTMLTNVVKGSPSVAINTKGTAATLTSTYDSGTLFACLGNANDIDNWEPVNIIETVDASIEGSATNSSLNLNENDQAIVTWYDSIDATDALVASFYTQGSWSGDIIDTFDIKTGGDLKEVSLSSDSGSIVIAWDKESTTLNTAFVFSKSSEDLILSGKTFTTRLLLQTDGVDGIFWNQIEDALSYEIYDENLTLIGSTTTLNYYVHNVGLEKARTYYVRWISNTEESSLVAITLQ